MNFDRYLAICNPVFHGTSITKRRLLILLELVLQGVAMRNAVDIPCTNSSRGRVVKPKVEAQAQPPSWAPCVTRNLMTELETVESGMASWKLEVEKQKFVVLVVVFLDQFLSRCPGFDLFGMHAMIHSKSI